ncbi:hypothetical protein CDL15_Pgr014282 [Punica granatum]|uniref:Uncharacterized protein n=1 Tax=Punica granatum TaxID=22663 RepID=A0A218WDP8_PUNGR|nr:hypothetical protein CDL15_Pgr014282 [Punica granatum]
MKKLISNSFKSLKKLESPNILNNDSEKKAALKILTEVERMSVSVFESLLCFLLRPRARSNSRSFVSKTLSSKQIPCENVNEVEDLNVKLLVLKSGKESNIQVHDVRKKAETLESSIQEIEEVLECISRNLVKTRVLLLNIISS